MINAKNQIKELLEGLGLSQELAVYSSSQAGAGAWTSVVRITLPERPPISGTGTSSRRAQADVAAAEDALAKLNAEPGMKPEDWEPIYAEAQAGDALLKLAGYLATSLATREERSWWLQVHESDGALARVFDRWFDEGIPELAMYGRGLGEKHKSTLVEALIWRRYGARVLGPGAVNALGELRDMLSRG
jgi:hypothetical protein